MSLPINWQLLRQRVAALVVPPLLGRDQFQSIEKLLHLLFYRSTFTFLVGILPSSTLRTFWGGTIWKNHPVQCNTVIFLANKGMWVRSNIENCQIALLPVPSLILKGLCCLFFRTIWCRRQNRSKSWSYSNLSMLPSWYLWLDWFLHSQPWI